MASILDSLRDLLDGKGQQLPSAAPGVGPEAERESRRVVLGGRIGEHITSGHDATGYGGHGDSVTIVEDEAGDVRKAVREAFRRSQQKALRDVRPEGRLRFNIPFSPEARIQDHSDDVLGPYSLFNGTITAPGAGNSVVPTAISLPVNVPSPVALLDRYPGAMYMQLRLSTFAIMPTGTTTTGLIECWFTDIGGAVCPLGIYNAAAQNNGLTGLDKLLTTPYTDPGNVQIGTLILNCIGIGGTPTSLRYQLGIAYEAMVPDPWFNQQMIVNPLPAEIAAAYETMES